MTDEEEIKCLKIRISELEDKDWYEGCIKQLEGQNDRLIKERDEAFRKVCKRIRKELKQLELDIDNDPSLISNEYKLQLKQKSVYKNIYKILDKIEKGENNE